MWSLVECHLANHWVYHTWTNHIAMRFHTIREMTVTEDIVLKKIHISESTTDMLTKPVPTGKFKYCLDLVSVCSLR